MKNVLLVDGHYTMRVLLRQIIENQEVKNQNVRTFEAECTNSGYEWVQRNKCDLIILDCMANSLFAAHAFLLKIKSNSFTKHIPVVAISSEFDMSYKYQMLEDGAIDYMLKPLDFIECKLKFMNYLSLGNIADYSALQTASDYLPVCLLPVIAA